MKGTHTIKVLVATPDGQSLLDREVTKPDSLWEISSDLDHGQERFTPLIMGGFRELAPEAEIPLSPTLKLNSDLTDLSQRVLLNIAKAELHRTACQNFKTYTVEAEREVAVISKEGEALEGFLHTWGGVLDLTLILLKKCHPDFLCAREITVESGPDGCHISLLEPSPVDTTRCTRCGACSWVCPEDCILPGPFFDLERCTLCGKCKDACDQNAIDLYGVIKREIHVPFLVCLQDVSQEEVNDITKKEGSDGHTGTKRIYLEDELEELFSNIFTHEIEEVIGYDPATCQYSPRLKKGCTRCITACDVLAIKPTPSGLRIDHLACVECGACVATCPTGAIQYERFNDETFTSYFRILFNEASRTQGERSVRQELAKRQLVIGTESSLKWLWWNRGRLDLSRQDGLFFLEHPNIGALSSTHLLALLDMGFKGVILIEPSHAQLPDINRQEVESANTILEALSSKASTRITIVKEEELLSVFSERGHNDGPGGQVETVGSSYVLLSTHSQLTRRELLAAILSNWISGVGPREGARVEPHLKSMPFQDLTLDGESCTHCLSCLNECRVSALTANEEELSLDFKPILCVACGLCVEVCPEKALSGVAGLHLRPEFFKRRQLFRAEAARCKSCGKVFGVKKSLDKVKTILMGRNDMDLEILELCEDCRVRRMYELYEEDHS